MEKMKKIVLEKSILLTLLVTSGVFVGGTYVFAEEPSENFILGEFVVTASRVATNKADTPANISVITKESIADNNYSDAAEAISKVPGVNVLGSGAKGTSMGQDKILINGDERVLVLIDGRRVNLGSSGNYSADWLPPVNAIERIEVLKGAGSALYGTDAVGGVINVITKKGSELDSHVTLRAATGSWNTEQYGISAGGATENGLVIFVSASKDRRGNYRYKDIDGDVKKMPNSGFNTEGFNLKLDQQVGRDNRVTMQFEHLNTEGGAPFGYYGITTTDKHKRLNNNLSMRYDWEESTYNSGYMQIYRNHHHAQFLSPDKDNKSDFIDSTWGVDLQQSFKLSEKNNLITGISYYKTEVNNDVMFDGKKEIDNQAIFLEDRWKFADSWQLNTGLRFDHHSTYGSELTRGTSVYDFTVMGNDQIVEKYLSNEQIRPYVSNLNRMEIGNIKSTASDGISSPVDWSKFRKQIVQHLPQDVVDPATQEDGMYSFGSDQPAALNLLGLIDTGSSSPYLLPVSSYNRLLDAAGEKQISLGNNEVVYYLNPDFLGNAQDETVTLLNQIAADAQANNEALLSINERPFYLVPSVPMKGLTADENIKIITALIVSDEIYSEFVNSDTCMVYWNFCIPNELVETKGLMLPIMEARDLLKPSGLYYESYLNNFGRQLFYVISGSYTTLYMGFMFLIIACALLALQFLTQMQTTKSRYLTLSILGARREQIKRSINQQVLWYFLLPLILACISGAVGIYAMQLYLYSGAAHLEQSYPLLIAMAVIVVLVMVIYGVAVARTANREIGKLNYKPNS